MALSHMKATLDVLYQAALAGNLTILTDGQLLGRFIESRDEAAFAALVKRHGPMVLGVCRRILRDPHEADDAFQAAFLVLVRKAASVVPRERVANWLYGVAHTTAVRCRAMAAKRRAREAQVKEMAEPAATRPANVWDDWLPLLDDELARLPDKYRAPVVLCDLEGKTQKQAAHQLGWPQGTVSGRLSRARVLLAKRLARRGGAALSGGALALALSHNAASACVPIPLIASTLKAAGLLVGGQAAGVVSTNVAALVQGVLKTMLLNRLKMAAMVMVAVCVLSTAGALARGALTHGPAASSRIETAARPESDDLQDAIVALENKLAEAWAKQDAQALSEYTADDFLGVYPEGRYTKADMLDGLPKLRVTTGAMEEVRLVVVNKDIVVLSYKARLVKSPVPRGPVQCDDWYISSTWVRRKNRWLNIFSAQTLAPEESVEAPGPIKPRPTGVPAKKL